MSEILTNKLTGVSTAGDVTVTEGSVTMKLQDGLAVVGIYYDLTNNINQQSWNVSSVTDHGTGNLQVIYTNNVSGNAISVYLCSNGTYGIGEIFGSGSNSHYQRIRDTGGSLQDTTQTGSSTHGDLA
tara:strand:- start:122 stop:502 length:381 start_codon:yes stop_codon:yes gene_type:complete